MLFAGEKFYLRITYTQAITNAQFHLHQDFMNESDFQIIEGFTQSVCKIYQ